MNQLKDYDECHTHGGFQAFMWSQSCKWTCVQMDLSGPRTLLHICCLLGILDGHPAILPLPNY